MLEASIALGTGCGIEFHQETREVYRLRVRGRACRIRFTNTQGRLRVIAVKLEGVEKFTRGGTYA